MICATFSILKRLEFPTAARSLAGKLAASKSMKIMVSMIRKRFDRTEARFLRTPPSMLRSLPGFNVFRRSRDSGSMSWASNHDDRDATTPSKRFWYLDAKAVKSSTEPPTTAPKPEKSSRRTITTSNTETTTGTLRLVIQATAGAQMIARKSARRKGITRVCDALSPARTTIAAAPTNNDRAPIPLLPPSTMNPG